MGFIESIKTNMTEKYVTFTGRASRSEFWYFMLFIFIASMVLGFADMGLGYEEYGPLSLLFSLAIILPSISVSVRRLHDIDRTGWWYWLYLVPLIGFIVLVVFACLRGTYGPNRFGHDPLEGSVENVF